MNLVLILFFILPLVACPLWGQAGKKKQLTENEYHLWGDFNISKISPDQNWVSYKMSYQNRKDTLFVRNNKTGQGFSFPNSDQEVFAQNNMFICISEDNLQITNLKTGQQKIISDVVDFGYSNTVEQLIILHRNEKNELLIQSPLGETIQQIQDVVTFSLSPDKNTLVYTTFLHDKYNLVLSDLKKKNDLKYLVQNSYNNFDDFVWENDGRSFAFFARDGNSKIDRLCYYILQTEKFYQLNQETLLHSIGSSAAFSDAVKVVINNDLKKVFFFISPKKVKTSKDSQVEIWNGNDKWVYAQEKKQGQFDNALKTVLWSPESNYINALTTSELPKIMLTGDKEFAVLSNPKDYEPQFDQEGPKDYYIMSLNTLKKNIFLKKQAGNYMLVIPSPQGKYVAYFKENNWWIYNIKTNAHTNVTAAIGIKFSGKVNLLSDESPYGSPGWNTNDREIIIYDQYDVWAVTPDGVNCRRLTHGRESHIKFRLAPIPETNQMTNFDGVQVPVVDLEKQLYLTAQGDDGKTGYFNWTHKTGEKPLVYKNSFIDQLRYNSQKQTFYYREQRYDIAPRLMSINQKRYTEIIYQSNSQQMKYYWGKSELLEYQNSKKQNLKGVLLYPADFDPLKKYPMVVRIYELQSDMLHKYINPSLNNEDGYNPTLLTTQGYFVFLPDIIHEKENPGISASDCVESGVRKVISMNLINEKKIALMGHSFGGYETAFIVTHTSLFTAAISSGGITDLRSFYLTINQNSGKPDMWRFQSQQWRMGKTPFEAADSYDRNSPVSNAHKINTPLLIWTGKDDEQVDPRQTMELYLALRRLNKKNIMLLYPNEGHIISNPADQIDLNTRVLQWFAYYLKEDTSIEWINRGMM